MIVAGLGCRPGCGAAEIVVLVRRAEAAVGEAAAVLAVPAFRTALPSVTEAAQQLGARLLSVDAAAMRAVQDRCPTWSELAAWAVGVASVAEGCALAVAGTGGRLVLPRISSANATCALARMGEAA